MEEIWKPIKNYTDYEVSNLGRVRSISGEIKKLCKIQGYPALTINSDGKRDTLYVHRQVAIRFVLNTDKVNKIQVNHKDGNKENNNYSNLEWVTPQNNKKHAYENKLSKVNWSGTLIEDITTGIVYPSIEILKKELNIDYADIVKDNGKRFKKL
jgi:hypothetical protein